MAFNIPIVLFFFKRLTKTLKVLEVIRKVKPKILYLFSDGPRNSEEFRSIQFLRTEIEKFIDWPCEVIKYYSDSNQGVFKQIGLGALKVFSQEKFAIFLEDDNLPTLSFFYYCEELLFKYQNDNKILWICGTNYTHNPDLSYVSDYFFSQHLFPCGWASWANKFSKYYQTDFLKLNRSTLAKIYKLYNNKTLFNIDVENWNKEIINKKLHGKYISWDYHMSFTLRLFDLYGIVPIKNQIKNIGVDDDSIHGGTSTSNVMVQRLTSMDHYELNFPLVHPNKVDLNYKFENKTSLILIPPIFYRIKYRLKSLLMKFFKYSPNTKTKDAILKWLSNLIRYFFRDNKS
jgi:hypothetical protein